ncbi:hypothetical protein S40288_04571, partial [Stachybotrys chartarum IBT 40288]
VSSLNHDSIVFIHGPNGGRTKTWTTNGTLWPEDFLPKTIPTARILTFGYDANIVHFWSRPAENRIDAFSNSFLSQLRDNRATADANHRPIIIVAHSLGGIVAANALVDAASNSYGELSANVRGILFLGTPHKGSVKAKWSEQARKYVNYCRPTNQDILEDLDEKSEKLAKIGDAFSSLLNTRGKLAMDETSATLPGYEKIPLHADHSGICKFASEEDDTYRQVSGQLAKWWKDFSKPDGGDYREGGRNAFFSGTNYGLQQYENTGTQTNNFGFKGN